MLLPVRAAAVVLLLALGSVTGAAPESIPNDVRYEIIKREVQPAVNNLKLWIRLNKPTSLDVVRSIGAKLKDAETNKFERVFIFYYLPDMRASDYAWAISHYTPKPEVKINGMSAALESSLSKVEARPGRTVIGAWLDRSAFIGSRIMIYEEGGRIFLSHKYQDGSESTKEFTQSESPQGTLFRLKSGDNPAKEYYLLDNRMNLQLWDKDGLVSTAKRIPQQ